MKELNKRYSLFEQRKSERLTSYLQNA